MMSEHDFRRSVAMAWINLVVYCNNKSNVPSLPTRKNIKTASASSSKSVASLVSLKKKLRSTPIKDSTLAMGGALSIRLDIPKE